MQGKKKNKKKSKSKNEKFFEMNFWDFFYFRRKKGEISGNKEFAKRRWQGKEIDRRGAADGKGSSRNKPKLKNLFFFIFFFVGTDIFA